MPDGIGERVKDRIILDLCGGTGLWSKPYADAGYNVKLITLPWYDVTDERTIKTCIDLNPYGILCATPCEVFGMMGNCRWKERTKEMFLLHAEILIKNLRIIYGCNPKFWCIENPPGKLRWFLGEPQYSFDPYEFGGSYHKKTLLWGKFNQPAKPIFLPDRDVEKDYIRRGVGGKSELRAKTPAAFAQAFFEANP